MPLRAVLFDAFGTVIHADPSWESQREDCLRAVHASWRGQPPVAWHAFLRAYEAARADQHARVKEAYAEFDFPERFATTTLACGASRVDARAWGPIAAERYHRYQEALIQAYDQPAAALAAVRGAGYKVALVSNYAHRGVLEDALARLGIRPLFDALVVSGEVGYMKPHPRVYQAALDALGVRAEDAVMVGDSLANDVIGAKRVGMRALWSPYPRERPAPTAPAADGVVERLADVPAIIGKW